jgi:pyridoxine 4-dehydrogenase
MEIGNRVGYGAMQLEKVDAAAARAVLERVRELGVELVDTAEFYGQANARIGEVLAPYEGIVVATKVGAARTADGRLVPAQQPAELREQVEANLTALGTERLGIVNLRRVDAPPGIVAEGDQIVDLDDQLAELVALRDKGMIGEIGLSQVTVEQLERALPAGIACVQNMHSLVYRGSEPVLDACRAHGIAWVPFFPLGSAFPGQPKVAELPAVLEIAAETGATPAQVGLAWELAHYERTLLIPGTSNPEHLAENTAAGSVVLSPDQLARLG